MKNSVLLLSLSFIACVTPVAPNKNISQNNKFKINQAAKDAGAYDPETDAGPVTSATGDARIAVAYCAAAVTDTSAIPTQCETKSEADGKLHTTCDTNLQIQWNCDTCGEIFKNEKELGFIVMKSNDLFQVSNSKTNTAYLCKIDPNGVDFTIELYR